MNDIPRDVTLAVRRLRDSDTPRKRRNARLAFARALRHWQAAIQAEYPALRDDGTAIVRRKPAGAQCPICRRPCRSFTDLVIHLAKSHDQNYAQCPCGWTANNRHFGRRDALTSSKAKHLAGVKDLVVHFAAAVLMDSAQGGAP